MNLNFLSHFKPLFGKYRYKVCFSGRGSGKSVHIAIALIWYASRFRMKILCVREFMNSIQDSSKAQLEEIIRASGTTSNWTITKNEIIHNVTKSKFIFKGLSKNYASLKSIPNIDICWAEECETLSKESLDVLIPTIRKQNSQLWFSGNPKDRMQAVAQMFIENTPPPDTVIISNSYLDNPYISDTLLSEAQHLLDTNMELYSYIWLGQYLDIANLILVKYVKRGEAPTSASDKVVVGVDIAKDGGDRTAIYVRRGRNVINKRVFATMDLKLLAHELHDVYYKYKPIQVNIDSTGSGLWGGSGLEAYGVKVTEINFSSRADEPEKYNNQRTEMYAKARKYFEEGGTIPTNDIELEKELHASYYTLDDKNRIKIVPKDEIKKRIGKSPDLADGFCLSLICDGDMFYDDSASNYIDNAMLAKSVLSAGMF